MPSLLFLPITNHMDIFYLSFPFLFLVLHVSCQLLIHKVRNLPPTPFPSLPFIGHLYMVKKPFHRGLSEASKRYGPVLFLRFGSRPVLLISSQSLAEECLSKNDITFADRPSLLSGKHFGYNYTSLAWCSYGEHWRNLRRIASLDLLSSNRIQMLAHIRADEIQILIHKLIQHKKKKPDEPLHVKPVLFEYTFNVLTRMVCGRRFYGKNVEKAREAEVFQEILDETSRVVPDASVLDFLPFMRWFGYKDTEKKVIQIQEKRDKFMQNVIEDIRVENTSLPNSVPEAALEKKNIAEILLSLQSAEPEYYTDEMIRNLLLVLLQAGSNTSSDTLEWAFSLLLDNPGTLRKAQAEIDNLVGKERLVTESDLAHLHYIRWIINETMRQHPAAPLLMPHASSKDCKVGGFHVPKGTILLVNAWDIHHDSKVWEEPEKFKPERFQGFEATKRQYKFIPFGSGRRACPGDNLAQPVIALALSALIQCFDWEKVGEIDMNEGTGITAPKTQPLTAKFRIRPSVDKLT